MNPGLAGWEFVCSALSPVEPESTERLRRLIALPNIWPEVVRLADSHLVTPAVWCGLVQKGLDSSLPDEPRRYLSSVYGMNQERNSSLLRQLDEAVLALNEVGIVPFLLKGAAHIRTGVYADPAARILVCSGLGEEALVAEAMGARAMAYVLKPFILSDLLEAVQSVL